MVVGQKLSCTLYFVLFPTPGAMDLFNILTFLLSGRIHGFTLTCICIYTMYIQCTRTYVCVRVRVLVYVEEINLYLISMYGKQVTISDS